MVLSDTSHIAGPALPLPAARRYAAAGGMHGSAPPAGCQRELLLLVRVRVVCVSQLPCVPPGPAGTALCGLLESMGTPLGPVFVSRVGLQDCQPLC